MDIPLKFLKDYWPIITALALLFIGVGETRYRISQLENHDAINESQWTTIRATATTVTLLADKHIDIDRVITPESMQKWGEVKKAVERHERDIYDIQKRLGSRSFQPSIRED